MIKFSLICENDHDFDGWFSSSEDFEKQQKKALVQCPFCDSAKVEKSLMAPSVSTSRKKEARSESLAMAAMDAKSQELMAEMRKIRDKVLANSEDVGEKFPEEARKIHYGEAEHRGIYGEANREEVSALVEEGIDVVPIPTLPDDAN